MAGVRILDPDVARRVLLHEALAQQTAGRELRDLGDGWLFHDPSDAEPFWNRLIAPTWPEDPDGFERRLDQVITIFATLGRVPHIRPLPVGGTPPDLVDRLRAAGFRAVGADHRMVLVDAARVAERLAAAERAVAEGFPGRSVRITRQGGAGESPASRRWADRRRWASAAALVLAEAFGVDDARRVALENDILACTGRPGCAVVIVTVDGEPAAIARRATTDGGTYLSSIGTRPAVRGLGLGSLVTLVATADALEAGRGHGFEPLVHLSVEVDNEAGRRLYERLGFVVVGEPTPDLVLR